MCSQCRQARLFCPAVLDRFAERDRAGAALLTDAEVRIVDVAAGRFRISTDPSHKIRPSSRRPR